MAHRPTRRAALALLLPALLAAAPASQPATGPTTGPATTQAASRPATLPATLPAAPPEVAALLDDLGSPDWATREKAQRALVAAGQSVRPFVDRRRAAATDPETRSRAVAVLRALDLARQFGQTRVTLHYDKADPKTVLNDLAKQAGSRFAYFPPPDPWEQFQQGTEPAKRLAVTADLTDVPFWQAMAEVCPQAGVQPMPGNYGNSNRPTLQWTGENRGGPARGGPDSPTVYSGPFEVRAVAASYRLNRNTNFGADNRNGSEAMSIQLQAMAEPKLTVLTASQSPTLTEATDNTGKSLLPAGQNRNEYYQPVNGWAWGANLQLEPDDAARQGGAGGGDAGRVLKTLRGSLAITVATGSRTLTVPNLLSAGGSTFEVPPYRVKVVRADPAGPDDKDANKDLAARRARRRVNGGAAPPQGPAQGPAQGPVIYVVTLLVSGVGPDGQVAAQDGTLRRSLQDAEVLDAAGNPLNAVGTNFDNVNQELQMVLRVATGPGPGYVAGPPQSLVWTFPTGSQPMEVPFEFHDLPLP